MAKKAEEKEMSLSTQLADTSLRPPFMQEDVGLGLDDMKKFIKPLMLKIVQKQSKEPLSTLFKPGDVILSNVNLLVSGLSDDSKVGLPFYVTPLFFFVNYITWNPIELRGTLDAIRKQTLDPKDPVAIKSRDPELRVEACPENAKYKIKHCEHLNFIFMIMDGPLAGEMCVASFARAEHKVGRNLASLIKLAKAPIFGRVYAAQTGFRTNAQGEWFGLDFSIPSPATGISSWVTNEAQYEALKATHIGLKEAHESNLIIIDHDEDELQESAESSEY